MRSERGEGRDLQVYTTGSHVTYLCVPLHGFPACISVFLKFARRGCQKRFLADLELDER